MLTSVRASVACHRMLLLASVVTIVTSGVPIAATQSPAPTVPESGGAAFEVTSVRPRPRGTTGGGMLAARNRLSFENMTVAQVIEYAFQVRAPQIVGGPQWLREDTFDIDGIAASDGLPSPEMFRTMTRTLLEQRFRLKAHRETRSVRVVALAVASNGGALGPALKRSTVECKNEPKGPTCWKRSRAGHVEAVGYDWQRINLTLDLMRYAAGRDMMIVDRTGLQGRFDLQLRWSPQLDAAVVDERPAAVQAGAEELPIATALRDQLGLVLRRDEMPIEHVVIDDVSRPTAN